MKKYETIVKVDENWGTVSPRFNINNKTTSGELKYFHELSGKRIKITIEVLDDDENKNKKEGNLVC